MIVVIDYKAGNLYNVGHALKFLGAEFRFSGDPEVVAEADKVILPGVGSARAAMDSLNERGLCDVIRELNAPFLGICLGLQLLFERSDEEDTECLGVLPGRVHCFDRTVSKVPQIGWNEVLWEKGVSGSNALVEAVLKGAGNTAYFYFVHSYYAPVLDGLTVGSTRYGVTFSSAVARKNFIGFQFHPERSGEKGLQLLRNFTLL